FLAAGEAKDRCAAQGGEFFGAVERTDDVGAILQLLLIDSLLEIRQCAVIRAGDDELKIGMRSGTDGKGVGQIIESFFIVNAREEEHVRPVGKCEMKFEECIAR